MTVREERLDRLVRVAAAVGHDLNNLVTIIAGHSDVLARRLVTADATLRGSVEGIRGAVERGLVLTRQLMAAVRDEAMPAGLDDLDEIVTHIEEDPPEEDDVVGHGPTATILVVDDEPQVRELIRDVLRGQGYRVLEAASGVDALDLVRRHEGSIDLVIADMVMPGTAGEALVTRLATACPGIKAVYMSGYARDIASQRGLGGSGNPFLEKPFSLEALTETVRDVLGR